MGVLVRVVGGGVFCSGTFFYVPQDQVDSFHNQQHHVVSLEVRKRICHCFPCWFGVLECYFKDWSFWAVKLFDREGEREGW